MSGRDEAVHDTTHWASAEKWFGNDRRCCRLTPTTVPDDEPNCGQFDNMLDLRAARALRCRDPAHQHLASDAIGCVMFRRDVASEFLGRFPNFDQSSYP